MISPKTQKLLVAIVCLLVLAFLGYRLYTAPASEEVASVNFTTEAASQDILTLVEKLEAISIDKSVFSSPIFTSLVDFTVPLLPEAQGRSNPFAPIGSDPK